MPRTGSGIAYPDADKAGYTRDEFDGVPTSSRERVYGDPNSSTPTRPGNRGFTENGLAKGVIHSKEQEDANRKKASSGATITNDDL